MELPPHLVADNKNLMELSKVRPSTLEKMTKVEGMTSTKVKRAGEQMLASK